MGKWGARHTLPVRNLHVLGGWRPLFPNRDGECAPARDANAARRLPICQSASAQRPARAQHRRACYSGLDLRQISGLDEMRVARLWRRRFGGRRGRRGGVREEKTPKRCQPRTFIPSMDPMPFCHWNLTVSFLDSESARGIEYMSALNLCGGEREREKDTQRAWKGWIDPIHEPSP